MVRSTRKSLTAKAAGESSTPKKVSPSRNKKIVSPAEVKSPNIGKVVKKQAPQKLARLRTRSTRRQCKIESKNDGKTEEEYEEPSDAEDGTSASTESNEGTGEEVVEIIEIVEELTEDSKAEESVGQEEMVQENTETVENEASILVEKEEIHKEVIIGDENSDFMVEVEECVVEEMQCDIDDEIPLVNEVDMQHQSCYESTSEIFNDTDVIDEQSISTKDFDSNDDAWSSFSDEKVIANDHCYLSHNEEKPSGSVQAVRKSKRSVKAVKKFEDFIVETNLPKISNPDASSSRKLTRRTFKKDKDDNEPSNLNEDSSNSVPEQTLRSVTPQSIGNPESPTEFSFPSFAHSNKPLKVYRNKSAIKKQLLQAQLAAAAVETKSESPSLEVEEGTPRRRTRTTALPGELSTDTMADYEKLTAAERKNRSAKKEEDAAKLISILNESSSSESISATRQKCVKPFQIDALEIDCVEVRDEDITYGLDVVDLVSEIDEDTREEMPKPIEIPLESKIEAMEVENCEIDLTSAEMIDSELVKANDGPSRMIETPKVVEIRTRRSRSNPNIKIIPKLHSDEVKDVAEASKSDEKPKGMEIKTRRKTKSVSKSKEPVQKIVEKAREIVAATEKIDEVITADATKAEKCEETLKNVEKKEDVLEIRSSPDLKLKKPVKVALISEKDVKDDDVKDPIQTPPEEPKATMKTPEKVVTPKEIKVKPQKEGKNVRKLTRGAKECPTELEIVDDTKLMVKAKEIKIQKAAKEPPDQKPSQNEAPIVKIEEKRPIKQTKSKKNTKVPAKSVKSAQITETVAKSSEAEDSKNDDILKIKEKPKEIEIEVGKPADIVAAVETIPEIATKQSVQSVVETASEIVKPQEKKKRWKSGSSKQADDSKPVEAIEKVAEIGENVVIIVETEGTNVPSKKSKILRKTVATPHEIVKENVVTPEVLEKIKEQSQTANEIPASNTLEDSVDVKPSSIVARITTPTAAEEILNVEKSVQTKPKKLSKINRRSDIKLDKSVVESPSRCPIKSEEAKSSDKSVLNTSATQLTPTSVVRTEQETALEKSDDKTSRQQPKVGKAKVLESQASRSFENTLLNVEAIVVKRRPKLVRKNDIKHPSCLKLAHSRETSSSSDEKKDQPKVLETKAIPPPKLLVTEVANKPLGQVEHGAVSPKTIANVIKKVPELKTKDDNEPKSSHITNILLPNFADRYQNIEKNDPKSTNLLKKNEEIKPKRPTKAELKGYPPKFEENLIKPIRFDQSFDEFQKNIEEVMKIESAKKLEAEIRKENEVQTLKRLEEMKVGEVRNVAPQMVEANVPESMVLFPAKSPFRTKRISRFNKVPEHPKLEALAVETSDAVPKKINLEIISDPTTQCPLQSATIKKDEDNELDSCTRNFDNVKISENTKQELSIEDFQNITISDVKSDEFSMDDDNSTGSSTQDNMKEHKTDAADGKDDGSIRRSTRIKTISSQKQRSVGHGLVRDKDKFLKKTTISAGIDSKIIKEAITGNFNMLTITTSDNTDSTTVVNPLDVKNETCTNIELSEEYLRDMEDKLSRFETIRENIYHCDRNISKEAKKMTCDCFLTQNEVDSGELGCGEDCLNRLLMIECGGRCVVGDRCTNRRFQKVEYANCQVFRTEKKGFGIQASSEILPGEFIMEYVGEVLNSGQFDKRAEDYSQEKNKHYYFMALRSDAIIDATTKGNISRFINHSCDPNAETQKWTVNGELRIGFFSTKSIEPGEEVTFDYQFQRYGKQAQKCYCEAENCRGWIGEEPDIDEEFTDEDEEDDEEEEEEQIPIPAIVELIPKTEVDQQIVSIEEVKSTVLDKPLEAVEEGQLPAEVTTTAEPITPPAKVKKIRRKLYGIKKKRQEIHDDPDLDVEIESLFKTGLKNQAHTLKVSRLMVRAKDIVARSRLLSLLRNGELPCRRLFLDYHGLRLLYGWICESTESIADLSFRVEILETLERLPIPNKTMLKDSKMLQTVEKWARIFKNSSITNSPNDGSDSNTSSDMKKDQLGSDVLKNMPELLKLADLGVDKLKEIINSCDQNDKVIDEATQLSQRICTLAVKLLMSWENLKEVFRIPKKERIEQMKEHEREADLRYKSLGLLDEEPKRDDRYKERLRDKDTRLKKCVDERDSFLKIKRNTIGAMPCKQDNLSKYQRRYLFEQKVAHEEAERRKQEMWLLHENNCMKFGLNPHIVPPVDVPAMMNPATGQYFSFDNRLLPTPPSHAFFKVNPPPMSTNPDDYDLPKINLPPLWKFAIDEKGRLYYFHVKERIPQWEPPPKLIPVEVQQPLTDFSPKTEEDNESISSDSSTTDTCDSSEDELNHRLEELLRRKRKQKLSFNLDDILSKPSESSDDVPTVKKVEPGDVSPIPDINDIFGDSFNYEFPFESAAKKKRKHGFKLVQHKIISPRTEEDKQYGQMEMKRYKETKEKLRKRKEDAKRQRQLRLTDIGLDKPMYDGHSSMSDSIKDALDKSIGDNSLMNDEDLEAQKIVEKNCIVDELDILSKKRPKKSSPYEEWKKIEMKLRLGKKRAASKSVPSKSQKKKKAERMSSMDLNSEAARKIKDKFRNDIAGVIVQHLSSYRKETCLIGKITNTDDFKHLARKLTHFVMLKELKHCDNTINELEVTDSVRTKAREFIKKYMAKHGKTYVRGENEPDF